MFYLIENNCRYGIIKDGAFALTLIDTNDFNHTSFEEEREARLRLWNSRTPEFWFLQRVESMAEIELDKMYDVKPDARNYQSAQSFPD